MSKLLLTIAVMMLSAAAAARADNVFISYAGGENTIQEYASGQISGDTYNGSVFTTANLSTNNGIAFNTSGNLFVADGNSGQITEYTSSGGNPPGLISNVFASGFGGASGLAFDKFGNLYVAYEAPDPNNAGNFIGTIDKITPAGVATVFASGSTDPYLSNPNGLAFGPNGDLYVALGALNPAIEVFTPGGDSSIFASANQIGSGPAGVGFTALSDPQDIAFDSSGNLYVANFNANDIEKFSPGGTPSAEPFATQGLANPHGLAFDSSGDLYVVNYGHPGYMENDMPPGYSQAEEFSSTGQLMETFNDNSADPSGLEDGSAIAIETNNGVPVLVPVPEPPGGRLLAVGIAGIAVVASTRRRRA